jgi:predicted transcriptional regulator
MRDERKEGGEEKSESGQKKGIAKATEESNEAGTEVIMEVRDHHDVGQQVVVNLRRLRLSCDLEDAARQLEIARGSVRAIPFTIERVDEALLAPVGAANVGYEHLGSMLKSARSSLACYGGGGG